MVDQEKIQWPIQKKLHHGSRLDMQSLLYLPPSLSLYPGKQNGLKELTPRCVPIIYRMPLPFILYEGPTVAVLLM